MNAFFRLKFLFVGLLLVSSCAVQSSSTMKLSPLGEVVIPYNYSFENTPVGGLSGLAYNDKSDKFYVVSDDPSMRADARFYSFRLQLNEAGMLDKNGIHLKNMTFLKNPDGERYKINTIDPEGITIGRDSLIYITSEGGRHKSKAPFINAYRKDGTFVKSLVVPEAYWPINKEDRSTSGIRTNLAFESLTITPDGKTLYAATESALMQDGQPADATSSSPARIIKYDLASGKILREYRYDVDKVFTSSGERGSFAVNGLSDLLALNNSGRLLALERGYVQGKGNHILLYELQTQGATDINGLNTMDQYDRKVKPVRKKLVADLSEYNITIDNYEGLVLGPELPGGGQLLLIVSDNNFSDAQQTLFTAFRLQLDSH